MSTALQYPPNPTLFVRNLNDTVHKDSLKRHLYQYFSQFGRILDIVALKKPGLQGQAWVAFDSVENATKALTGSQGFQILGKSMRVEFSNKKSEIVAQEDGTWINPNARPKGAGADGKQPTIAIA
jgi:U2 small nuclear ribonucleoprotein B''|eukprot:g2409.t1